MLARSAGAWLWLQLLVSLLPSHKATLRASPCQAISLRVRWILGPFRLFWVFMLYLVEEEPVLIPCH